MKKQIDVWEGAVKSINSLYYDGFCIDDDRLPDIMDYITYLEGKKVRVTIEVIE